MSDLHALRVEGNLEAVDPGFARQGLLDAREKTWAAFREIRSRLFEGMTEAEGRQAAIEALAERGATKHWHKPYVRFGPGTALTFHDPLQKHYRLQPGDPIYMDLGPVWSDPEAPLQYEGDVGDTFVFGSNREAESCARCARTLWTEARKLWETERASGEVLYAFLKKRASEQGYALVEQVNGHRLGDYPHIKYSKERLSKVAFPPSSALWILEFQINDPGGRFGAFYEDLLQ